MCIRDRSGATLAPILKRLGHSREPLASPRSLPCTVWRSGSRGFWSAPGELRAATRGCLEPCA
eukprot:1736842-Pyramimonas_sp.AAC.1